MCKSFFDEMGGEGRQGAKGDMQVVVKRAEFTAMTLPSEGTDVETAGPSLWHDSPVQS